MDLVEVLAGVARPHPQTGYAGLQNYLQQEWDFIHCVTPGIKEDFRPDKEALQKSFLPDLLQGYMAKVPDQGVTRLSVKQVWLATPNFTLSASKNWTASCVVTGHLVTALWGRTYFKTR